MTKSITLKALADLIQGTIVQGDPETVITGLNSLSESLPGDVSFLGNAKYAAQVAKTQAAAVIIAPDFTERPERIAFIAVPNPTLAFSAVISYFGHEKKSRPPGIHPSAVVSVSAKLNAEKVHVGPLAFIDDDAEIGDGCIIHAGACIGPGVKLGLNCIIHSNAVIKDYCQLGERVVVHSGTVIGSDGFGYEFVQGRHVKIDQVGIVEIGDDVEIGSCTTIDRARFGKTIIGTGSKIDNLVQIAHNVVIGPHCVIVAQVGISGSTKLGSYVVMGGQAGSAGHLNIGDQVTVLGRSGVTKDLPGPGHYTGFPARPLHEGRKLLAAPGLVPGLQTKLKALEARLAELEKRLPG
ncbi:MAG: UDP-3-O-(3-hydroxymyristoyl)glucosamine N-acyltransferase [Verrucomicrobiaceae bacterium]|nr:UDP-3-O-(3-hydroxymyristoyl)glucosamine N-acyltransferase [Verrucomicrobiaceae bacterium]